MQPKPGGPQGFFVSHYSKLSPRQRRILRADHANPDKPTAEAFSIAPAKGRGPFQPVTRQEFKTFVNNGFLPPRLLECERKVLAGSENLPIIEIPESTDGLHDA
jgi:hypothetical protein